MLARDERTLGTRLGFIGHAMVLGEKKVTENFGSTGKTIRLGRILNPRTGRAAVVAFDHGVHLGPVPGNEDPGRMLETLTVRPAYPPR